MEDGEVSVTDAEVEEVLCAARKEALCELLEDEMVDIENKLDNLLDYLSALQELGLDKFYTVEEQVETPAPPPVDKTVQTRHSSTWDPRPGTGDSDKARLELPLVPRDPMEVASELAEWLRQWVNGTPRGPTTIKWLSQKALQWWKEHDRLSSGISIGDQNTITMQAVAIVLPVTSDEWYTAMVSRDDSTTVSGSLYSGAKISRGHWLARWLAGTSQVEILGLGNASSRNLERIVHLEKLRTINVAIKVGAGVVVGIVSIAGVYMAYRLLCGSTSFVADTTRAVAHRTTELAVTAGTAVGGAATYVYNKTPAWSAVKEPLFDLVADTNPVVAGVEVAQPLNRINQFVNEVLDNSIASRAARFWDNHAWEVVGAGGPGDF